jgi:hypothetical protein
VVCAVGLWGCCRLCVSYRKFLALILQRRRRFFYGTKIASLMFELIQDVGLVLCLKADHGTE